MHPRIPRRVAALAVFALVAASCTSSNGTDVDAVSSNGAPTAAAGQPSDGQVAVPLPTIGLGSDTGSGSVAAPADSADSIERIVMIGDSITVASTPFLSAGFEAAGLPAEIGAQQGKRIDVSTNTNPAGSRLAEEFAVGAGDDVAWVVALGTNDIGQYADQADVEQEIRDLLAYVPQDAPLIWINTWFRDRPDATVMVNEAIESVLRQRGNATIGDWSVLAPVDGVLRSDGVHPNEDGAQVFADLVVGTARNFLQR